MRVEKWGERLRTIGRGVKVTKKNGGVSNKVGMVHALLGEEESEK